MDIDAILTPATFALPPPRRYSTNDRDRVMQRVCDRLYSDEDILGENGEGYLPSDGQVEAPSERLKRLLVVRMVTRGVESADGDEDESDKRLAKSTAESLRATMCSYVAQDLAGRYGQLLHLVATLHISMVGWAWRTVGSTRNGIMITYGRKTIQLGWIPF